MLEFLLNLDTKLFLFFNGIHSDFFDGIMVWISGKTTWWPFYLVLLLFLGWKLRWKALLLIPFIALCITLTDQVSVHLFKDVFERLRPCKEPGLAGMVHLVNGKCGGKFGFVSSHASNSFGIALLLILTIRKSWFTVILLGWAILVSYSRIYLGLHYPGDILGGALLGSLIGYLVYRIYTISLNFLLQRNILKE